MSRKGGGSAPALDGAGHLLPSTLKLVPMGHCLRLPWLFCLCLWRLPLVNCKPLQQLPGNQQPLNLACTLTDEHKGSVTIIAFDIEFFRIAQASKNTQCF